MNLSQANYRIYFFSLELYFCETRFFCKKDCAIKDGVNGIHMTLSREGRPSGEAYIEMETEDAYRTGLDHHKKHMGSRYIEVFPSKKSEMDWMIKRSGVTQFNCDPNFDGFVRLRGLPFNAKREDIEQFFEGILISSLLTFVCTDKNGICSQSHVYN